MLAVAVSSPAADDTSRAVDAAARRYRCTSCGNVTRFTVTSRVRTRAFHHFTLGGELSVEDDEVLESVVEDVACRWCGGTGAAIEELDA
jgi:hypothetical protein